MDTYDIPGNCKSINVGCSNPLALVYIFVRKMIEKIELVIYNILDNYKKGNVIKHTLFQLVKMEVCNDGIFIMRSTVPFDCNRNCGHRRAWCVYRY